jgi:hypothetical protein
MKTIPFPTPAIHMAGRNKEILIETPGPRFEGWVTVDLIHARTGLVKQHLEFRNLITNAGMDGIGAGALNMNSGWWAGVGTGTTVPAVTDTALQAEILPRTSSNNNIADVTGSTDVEPRYSYRRITRWFTETQANGNLTEFGIFLSNTASTMWCRQLFLDGNGQPTTVVKTSADQLQITYETRVYMPLASTPDVTGNMDFGIAGDSVNFVTRPANLANGGNGTGGTGTGRWALLGNGGGVSLGYWQPGTPAAPSTGNGPIIYFSTQTLTASTAGLSGTAVSPSSQVHFALPYTAGSYYRDSQAQIEPGSGDLLIGMVGHALNGSGGNNNNMPFQTRFGLNSTDGPIHKTAAQRLILVFRYPFGRYP